MNQTVSFIIIYLISTAMKTYKLAWGVASTIALGIMMFYLRKNKIERRMTNVADAGYETAYDVLYPLKTKRYIRH